MLKKKSCFVLVAIALCTLPLMVGCKKHHDHGAFALDYISEVLDLTEPQEEMLQSIHGEIAAELELLHKDKEQMRDVLKEQLTAENVDKEVIRQMVQEHRAGMDTVIDLAIDKLGDFHGELTPDQRTKLVAKLEKFAKHRGHRWTR